MKNTRKSPHFKQGWIGLCYNKDVLTIAKLGIIIIINILWQPGIMALVIR